MSSRVNDDGLFHAWADGGARGNPGPAGIGFVIEDAQGTVLREVGEYIGEATNNVAEYKALIGALKASDALGVEKLRVHLDSELVVRQMSGAYKVKNETLKSLHRVASGLLRGMDAEIVHVAREKNAAADAMVNQAIDDALSGTERGPQEASAPDQQSLF